MASRDLNVALAGKERVQDMLQQLQAFERFVASSLDKATDSGGRIRTAADEAVTALQFEDIIMQLLQAILDRVMSLKRWNAGEELAASSGAGSANGPTDDHERSNAQRSLDAIQQRSVVPGDIELF
jgi:hypothetical protein